MKIIELLNKIANGEEVPKKIEYKGEIYNRQQNTEKNSLYYYQVLGQCKFFVEQLSSVNDLIDEVEILEEEKEIPEKIPIGLKQTKDGIFNTIVKDDIQYELNEKEEIICKKIHEIIDYLKNKGDE